MLTLNEHKEINETIGNLDSQFTDDIIDQAEFYDIDEDEITLMTTVTIYDINGVALSTAVVEDYEIAMSYMEEVFDLEEMDEDDVDADAAAVGSRYGHNS